MAAVTPMTMTAVVAVKPPPPPPPDDSAASAAAASENQQEPRLFYDRAPYGVSARVVYPCMRHSLIHNSSPGH